MAKSLFAGLVKISGNNWAAYESAKTTGDGKIIFADITTEGHVGKYIYANGIEYAVADSSAFADLEARVSSLEDWKTVVDSSIATIDSSVHQLEEWKAVVDASQASQDASISDHQTRIVNLESASTALGERIANVSQNVIDISTYVHTTVNGSINDISSRLASVGITAADNSIGVNNTSIQLASDNYVSLTAAGNTVTASIKDSALVKGTGTGASDVSLATKGYVDEQVAVLEQALVFKGDITGTADASSKLTDASVQAGYTYVTTAEGEYNGKKFDAGDLIIVKTDSAAGSDAIIIVVERNLDGAVTAGAALDSSHLVVGTGNQGVKTINVTAEDLATAIANANSALQTVTASTSTGDYVTINAVKDASNTNVSVGVKVATLADASDGGADFKALADARDVYDELTRVEEVTATSITTMADSLGLGSALDPNWSEGSGINEASTYREVIEELHGQVGGHVVNSFAGKVGDISIDNTTATDGSLNFAMDGSTLKGTVVGWSGLVNRVTAAETSIGDVSARLNETSTRLNDLSTYVRETVDASIDALQAKDIEIDASIDRLDASVNALENANYVHTLSGESAITGGDGNFVAVKVDTSTGDVTLSSELKLADNTYGSTTATGLATDAYVKDYLAWEVIE